MTLETIALLLPFQNFRHSSVNRQELPIVRFGIEASSAFDHDRQVLWLGVVGLGKSFPNNDRTARELNWRIGKDGLARRTVNVNYAKRFGAVLMGGFVLANSWSWTTGKNYCSRHQDAGGIP